MYPLRINSVRIVSILLLILNDNFGAGSREKLVIKRTHNRPKESVSPQTAQIMKDKLALEYELYYFVRQRFYYQLRKLAIAEDDKHLATNSNISQQS